MSSFLSRAVLAASLCTPVLAVAQDAPVTDGEAAAPTETDAKTRAFLEMASEAMYQPAKHGLESLSFDIVLPGAAGPLATISCSWTKGSETQVSTKVNLEGIPEAQRPLVEAQTAGLDQSGYEYMTLQLNTVLENNLKNMVATLRGVEDGLIAVQWTPKPDSAMPPIEQTYFFDDDGLWIRTKGELSMQGQKLPNTESLTWAPVEGSDEFVQVEMASEIEIPFAGSMTQTVELDRADIHGFNLVKGMTITAKTPMGPQTQTMAFENIVVNGKPYPGESTDG